MKLNLFAVCQMDRLELKRLKEYDWQVALTQYMTSQGWKVSYFRKSASPGKDGVYRGLTPPGWPDVVGVRGSRMVVIECKREGGKETPEQMEWLKALASVPGIDAYVAKPRDAAELMGILAGETSMVKG